MKICWNNLENIHLTRYGKFKKKGAVYIYKENCKICNDPYLTLLDRESDYCSMGCLNKDRNFTETHRKNISISRKNKLTKNENPNWNGGYNSKNIPNYNTYANQISYVEEIRKNKDDENIIEVKCTYCGKWYIPKLNDLRSRINALNGIYAGEYRLYCSDKCKQECSIYRQVKYPKGFKADYSREVQTELRKLVFERDNYTCQKCHKHKDELEVGLHCHHVEGIRWEPLESADMDKTMTICKDCHEFVHLIEGCMYYQLKCIKEDYEHEQR